MWQNCQPLFSYFYMKYYDIFNIYFNGGTPLRLVPFLPAFYVHITKITITPRPDTVISITRAFQMIVNHILKRMWTLLTHPGRTFSCSIERCSQPIYFQSICFQVTLHMLCVQYIHRAWSQKMYYAKTHLPLFQERLKCLHMAIPLHHLNNGKWSSHQKIQVSNI